MIQIQIPGNLCLDVCFLFARSKGMWEWLQENKGSEEEEKGMELANPKGLFFQSY